MSFFISLFSIKFWIFFYGLGNDNHITYQLSAYYQSRRQVGVPYNFLKNNEKSQRKKS